jgi:hypothetical protein
MERVNAAAIGLTGVAVLGRGTPQAQQVAGIQGPIERILSHILDTKTDSAADLRTMMGKVAGEADKLRASVSGDAG